MGSQIYLTEPQLNKANSVDSEVPGPGIVSSKIYDKRYIFPRSPSYGAYISQLIRFARVCSNVNDFNNRNICLTAKLLKQDYHLH